MISAPATYRDVQQELIAGIHRTFIWPVVVTVDGNISIPEQSIFINRDGNYIILIPDGNIKSVKAEIKGLGSVQFTRIWNSEARFIVAGANEFSMSQQTDIIKFFSRLRIYNCIIVSQEHYLIDKEYSRQIKVNDVESGMKLGVYTWFPYQSKDRCTEVNDITLLDSWVIDAEGHFTKNTDLFPRKIKKNLNGCPMKTLVRNAKWYFTTNYAQNEVSNGSLWEYIEGLEYDLLKVILQQMNMELVPVPTPEVFEMDEETVHKLMFDMFDKKIHIALGGIGTEIVSQSFFDSTYPYYMMSVRWYVPCSVKYPRWSSIFRIHSVELWLVLIISIVIAAISTTLVGRYSCTSDWQGYKTLTSSLTNVWAVILGVSVSTMPRTPSLRSLFLAWVFFSMAFSTVFQAFLTTFLIDSGYKKSIQNLDELFASGIKLAYPPEYNFIFELGDETEVVKIHRNRANCPSYKVCMEWAKCQKNVSILMDDRDAEEKYARGYFVGENSEPLVCRLEDDLVYFTGLHMVMFHGDRLLKRVNEIINSVVEAGLYKCWISISDNKFNLMYRKIAASHPLDGYYSFKLYNMQPAFYLLFLGLCLSVLCFIVELFYNCVLNKRMRI